MKKEISIFWFRRDLRLDDNKGLFNALNENETVLLKHLQKIIDSKKTNADHMVNRFSKSEDLSELYDK